MGDDVNKPNARFPHAYVVLRIEDTQNSADVENQISPVERTWIEPWLTLSRLDSAT